MIQKNGMDFKWYLFPLLICAAVIVQCTSERPTPGNISDAGRPAAIEPDYTDMFIPPNIAPLNFTVKESGTGYYVKIYGDRGDTIEVSSGNPKIIMPKDEWNELCSANAGAAVYFEVFTKHADGSWKRYAPTGNTVAREEIDGYVVFRRIRPLHNIYLNIDIVEHSLETHDESTVLSNDFINNGCINCHTFLNKDPDNMLIHTRGWGESGVSMILTRDGEVVNVNTRTTLLGGAPMAYSSWHPSGRLLAFSVNKVYQFQHSAGWEVRDVIDLYSEIGIYSFAMDSVMTHPAISRADRMETYPSWSPAGDYLYYSSALTPWSGEIETWPPPQYKDVKYDLMRIGYDIQTNTWGEPETLLRADSTNMSILLPRVSPDGRFLLFCMSEYGCFPVYQPSSDLYLMDLKTHAWRKLAINSEYSESWHSWSSNSRWIAFTSKRLGGYLSRTFISYVDEAGNVHKPFILPHKDPEFYSSSIHSFSVPELVTGPGRVRKTEMASAPRLEKAARPLRAPADSSKGYFY